MIAKGYDPYNHDAIAVAVATASRRMDVIAWPGNTKAIIRGCAADEQREQRTLWWKAARPRGK